MALIVCPECGKEVSDRAAACPVCGYPFVDAKGNQTERERTTRLGKITRNPVLGVVLIIVGIVVIIFSLLIIFSFGIFGIILGIFSMLLGGALIYGGFSFCKGSAKCKCPFCGKIGSITITEKTYRCPGCKKVSTVDIRHNCLRTSR